jgi:uncharacterized damage-inducible protein DinB
MNSNQTLTKMVLDRWNANIKNFDAILNVIPDEKLQMEIAPGKNRGIYLLGHLIAAHDDMFRLLDFGDKLYPELNKTFIEAPDKATAETAHPAQLRTIWKKQCETLTKKFETMQTDDWFQKHTAVTAEEFSKEPHRNKLNILLTRTTHLSYHTGQFVLIK